MTSTKTSTQWSSTAKCKSQFRCRCQSEPDSNSILIETNLNWNSCLATSPDIGPVVDKLQDDIHMSTQNSISTSNFADLQNERTRSCMWLGAIAEHNLPPNGQRSQTTPHFPSHPLHFVCDIDHAGIYGYIRWYTVWQVCIGVGKTFYRLENVLTENWTDVARYVGLERSERFG